jgi:hypothetical protein
MTKVVKEAGNAGVNFLRLPEQAERLGIAPRTLRAWATRRLIPSYCPTRRLLLFDPTEVAAALAKFRRA